MLTELKNATIVDPLHARRGQRASLFIRDGVFIERPAAEECVDEIIDLDGGLCLAGGIDIHTHIGGGKVNLARLLMPATNGRPPAVWPTGRTGELYNLMGYTTCFEPAMLLSGARHTHLELADTPGLDAGAYVVMGNDDWLLQALARGVEDPLLDCLVGWSLSASHAMAVKVVNAGGIDAFKFGQRALDVDQPHRQWGVTPGEVLRRLAAAVRRVGIVHPLHVHASNLGMPGNVSAALATLQAVDGERIHLTHAQFNAYSAEGPYGMGSGAEALARYVNSHDNVSLDVGQIVFGQTVTISADAAAQYRNSRYARPKRWIVGDIECQAGCGVVPMRYEDSQYVHSLQWTIGLELMLLIEDPWRVFLTTDHPNGGPFTSYPHLLRLLMDRSYRQSMLETIHPQAAQRSLLRELTREYTLEEVAILTRAAPARILGLRDRGSLRPGMVADVAVYRQQGDWQSTFERAAWVFKSGQCLVSDGELQANHCGCQTLAAAAQFDAQRLDYWAEPIAQTLRLPHTALAISPQELADGIRRPLGRGAPHTPHGASAERSHVD